MGRFYVAAIGHGLVGVAQQARQALQAEQLVTELDCKDADFDSVAEKWEVNRLLHDRVSFVDLVESVEQSYHLLVEGAPAALVGVGALEGRADQRWVDFLHVGLWAVLEGVLNYVGDVRGVDEAI